MNRQDSFSIESYVCIHGFHRSHRFFINVMVRSELYNGARNKISYWSNPPSRYWSEALYFLWTDSYNYVWIHIDALLHDKMFQRPYILEFYIFSILFFFLSPFRLSVSFSLLFFIFLFCLTINLMNSLFQQNFQLLQW